MSIIYWNRCDSELPAQIVGKIVDLQTAKPVEGASVYIKASNGVNVTMPGGFLTDSRGIFIVDVEQPAHWGDSLVIHTGNCQAAQEVVLSKKAQLVREDRLNEFSSIPLMLLIPINGCPAGQTKSAEVR